MSLNKKDSILEQRKALYEKSMRRRINFDYAVSYIVIGAVMFCVFCTIYGLHLCDVLAQNTPYIADKIKQTYVENNGALDGHLRATLLSIVSETDANEVIIYDAAGNVLMNSSGIMSNNEATGTSRVLSAGISKVSAFMKGYYEDEEIIGDVNLKIAVKYSLSDIRSDFVSAMLITLCTLALGAAVFSFTGFVRIRKLLSPIDEMTAVAKTISADNLDKRLDEEGAKYELSELAATINKMIDRLEASYERQKHFVSDVSHELRTPISVISGYAAMLKRWGKSDEEVLDESIEAIINETDNMQNLVEALLFLTRHDNKTIKYEYKVFDLSALAEEIVTETEMVHPEFAIKSMIQKDVLINADEARIKQLMRILIENAVKYSADSRILIIGVSCDERFVRIKVKDFGIGIDKKDLHCIFDRFYRADESRTKLISGYGLGLAMAKAVTQGHRGKIVVASKLGEGSEFTVILPKGKINFAKARNSSMPDSAGEEGSAAAPQV